MYAITFLKSLIEWIKSEKGAIVYPDRKYSLGAMAYQQAYLKKFGRLPKGYGIYQNPSDEYKQALYHDLSLMGFKWDIVSLSWLFNPNRYNAWLRK